MSQNPRSGPTRIEEHQERSEGDINRSALRGAFQDRHLDDATRETLTRDEEVFLHQSLSTPCLNALAGAEGIYLIDEAGHRIMDFHGNGVHHVGFGHPRVVEAVKSQMDTLPFCTRRYTNRTAIQLAETLIRITPESLSKVLFAPGGTSAIGIALKLARLATGRYKTISMWGSFHGASMDVIAVGGQELFHGGLGPLSPGALHVRPPIPTDCPFGCGEVCSNQCADYLRHVMQNEGEVAAVIAEPVRWSTVTIPPPGYWEQVRTICNEHGALLIFDEIGTGLGRTGNWFAFEHFDVVPDMVVVGKGFGGGILPMAGVVARPDLDIAGDRAIGHYTHEKSPLGAVAALATLDVIETENLTAHTDQLGRQTVGRLRELQQRYPLIREIRGLGLLIGVELQDPPSGKPATYWAEWIMYRAMELGLSFKVSGGNVLTLTPPLVITEAEMDAAIGILETCFEEATAR